LLDDLASHTDARLAISRGDRMSASGTAPGSGGTLPAKAQMGHPEWWPAGCAGVF